MGASPPGPIMIFGSVLRRSCNRDKRGKTKKTTNTGSRRDPVWGTRQLKVPIHLPKSCSPPRVNFNGDQRLVVANLERSQGGSESLRSWLEGFGTWQLNGPHLFESRRGPWARRLDRSIIDRNKTSGGLLWMDSAAYPWLSSNEGQRRSSLSTRGAITARSTATSKHARGNWVLSNRSSRKGALEP